MYSKYITSTNYTVTQLAHVTFLSRNHHGLYIPSMFVNQLHERARELDVRRSSSDPVQYTPPFARHAAMATQPNHHKNLTLDAITSLAQHGLHFRYTDQSITSIALKLLLHAHTHRTLLGQPPSQPNTTLVSPFTTTGDMEQHIPYSHN